MASDKTCEKLIMRKGLFPCLDTRCTQLEPRYSKLSSFKDRGQSHKVRVLRDCQLTFARYCIFSYINLFHLRVNLSLSLSVRNFQWDHAEHVYWHLAFPNNITLDYDNKVKQILF